LSLATPLLMLSGSIAAQSAQSEGGAGFGSPIRSAESSQEGNGAISMKVMPERVTIVPELPERVEVLSLNNSLINFQRQDTIWNNIAAKMGTAVRASASGTVVAAFNYTNGAYGRYVIVDHGGGIGPCPSQARLFVPGSCSNSLADADDSSDRIQRFFHYTRQI